MKKSNSVLSTIELVNLLKNEELLKIKGGRLDGDETIAIDLMTNTDGDETIAIDL